jgi:multiple sugar transport system permease protein
MAAYAFARLKFPGRDLIFSVVLATLMVPGQVTIIPLYLFFNDIYLLDTYSAVILPRVAAAIGVFMLRQFFLGIPKDLEDAARIDGCSRYSIFVRIILPLARPAMAALAIFTFVWSWNDFMWPLIALPSKEMYTLPVGISTLVGYYARDWGMQMAGAFIASAPVLVLFLFFQREFIQGIAMTGLKG